MSRTFTQTRKNPGDRKRFTQANNPKTLHATRIIPDTKECLNCSRVRTRTHFALDIRNTTGLRMWCRDCERAAELAHRLALKCDPAHTNDNR